MVWYEAAQYCGEWGGTLASIKNAQEENAAMSLVDNKDQYWLGLRYRSDVNN